MEADVSAGFTVSNVVYTVIGAAVYWGRTGRSQLRPYVLAKLIDRAGLAKTPRVFIEFFVFVALGCIVGIGMVDPRNAVQALTAGFAWTGAIAAPEKAGK